MSRNRNWNTLPFLLVLSQRESADDFIPKISLLFALSHSLKTNHRDFYESQALKTFGQMCVINDLKEQ